MDNIVRVGIIVEIGKAQSKPKDQPVLTTKNNDNPKNNLEYTTRKHPTIFDRENFRHRLYSSAKQQV